MMYYLQRLLHPAVLTIIELIQCVLARLRSVPQANIYENRYRADENRSIRQLTSHVHRSTSNQLNLFKLLNVSALIPVCKCM